MVKNLRLAWCSYEAAKYAVEHWHYSRTMPKCKTMKIGVWEDDAFIGCVIFSRGATPQLLHPYGLSIIEGCELTRIALNTHKAPVSRIISISLKMLKKECESMRLVVSFADPAQGHVGAIYQASGWLYCGTTSPSALYRDEAGKLWHGRNLSETGIKKYGIVYLNVRKPSELQRIDMPGKHRYLYPLDPAMRAQIEPLRKPYPKRGSGEIDNAAQSNVQTGGASPTDPLLEMQ